VFIAGEMHVHGSSARLEGEIKALQAYYGAKPGHLPSTQVQIPPVTDWIAGPMIVVRLVVPTQALSCADKLPAFSCSQKSDQYSRNCGSASSQNGNSTHAVFLFPWEAHNTFHALNDNVLSVLSNVILHYLHTPAGLSALSMPRYTLYTFQSSVGAPTLMFHLLSVIFGTTYNRPARALLAGGPHCVRSLSWVSPIKPFYKDTLADLRRASYDVLQHILNAYSPATTTPVTTAVMHGRHLLPAQLSLRPARAYTKQLVRHSHTNAAPASIIENNQPASSVQAVLNSGVTDRNNVNSGSIHVGTFIPGAPRLVIVTRRGGSDPSRKINPASELQLLRAYEKLGFNTEICCDFSMVNTVPLLLEHFLGVDVCVGIHGAGLTNCVFGRPGMTVVELQTHHGYGSLLFHKIAHMAGGQHLFYDLRNIEKMKGVKDAGFELGTQMLQELTSLTLLVHRNSPKFYPTSTKETAAKAAVVIRSADKSLTRALNEVVVIAPARRTVYVNQPDSALSATAVRQLFGTNVTYTLKSLPTWLKLPEVKDGRKRSGWEYAVATINRNRGTYWVQLSPSREPYTMVGHLLFVLGYICHVSLPDARPCGVTVRRRPL
jgi:hypothetical protein